MVDADPTSGRAPGNERDDAETDSPPPLADLTDRPSPAPGPLTKPAPVVRPPRQRARWIVPVTVVLVLAAVAAGIIVWQAAQSGIA
ncbi:hypothetical protein [Microbacterium abyssi]|uniref:hypothetical protein n=1 Tax=Microbacterium abyssi TaxID=2782166 RepID=UPI001889B445|nr:hypothetical protein [Microbacterium sp. A18JL241]